MLKSITSLCNYFAILGLAATASSNLCAQQVYGAIFGNVTDVSGSVVVNANVTIRDTSKNVSFQTNTNVSGFYSKGQLIPGTYRVQVEANGFRAAVSSDIVVTVDATSRFDVQLSVGDTSQVVEVTVAAPLLETARADVANTFTERQILQLPNYQRNLLGMVFLTPGVQLIGGATPASENPQGSFRMMVNGQNFGNTGYQLDGTDNQDPLLGGSVINPNLDALSEAKFATQDYDAEFGYVGAGMMSMSTRSGSNQFHGSAFEYLINNTPGFTTFGRNPFTEPGGASSFKSNQFGGSLGGRIIRDKLFFFGDVQSQRKRQSAAVLTTVPDPGAARGDLSAYLSQSGSTLNNVIYDPLTGDPTTGQNRQQFAGNIIPASRLSSQALKILKYFPAPNTKVGGTAYKNNYIGSGAIAFDADQWDLRGDYYLNAKNSVFGRYTSAAFNLAVPGAFGLAGGAGLDTSGFSGQSNVFNQSIAAGFTHTFSPNSINEFRFGYLRYRVSVTPNGFGTSPAKDAGIPGLNLDSTFTSGMPYFNITGDGGAALGYALNVNRCNCPLAERERQYQFVDNYTRIGGNHTFKFGADYRYELNLRVPSDSHRSGELTFAPGYTARVDANGATSQGLGVASFLLGQVTSFGRYVSPSTDAQENQKRAFFYVQDSWRVSPKLTVNYGLRWELVFPETVNAPGNGGALDLSTGKIAVYGVGRVPINGIQNMTWTNIAPRLGIAYQLRPKTVIRAGYGWSYGMGVFGDVFGHVTTQNLPVLASQSLNAPNAFSGVFTLNQGPPAPTFPQPDGQGYFALPNGVAAKVRPAQVSLPLVMAHNLSIQHQLTNAIAVTASYVGNGGRHVINGNGNNFDVNQATFIPGVPNQNVRKPFYARYGWTQPITYFCDCANSTYNAFQLKAELRGFHGYTAVAHYNYQNAVGDSANAYTFLYNRSLGYGNQPLVSKQQFLINQIYALPFGAKRRYFASMNAVAEALFGGWELSGTTTYYTGLPFTATIGAYPATVNGVAYTHPDVGPSWPDRGTGSPYAGSTHDRNQWFVGGIGGAFALPTANSFGNFGFNNLYGPIFINQDLALAKSFALREGYRLSFRAEAYNAFNHTNLGLPDANITNKTAGQITSLAYNYQMRRLQFALRLDF